MTDLGRTGLAMIVIAFPVYLLWRGRLPTYMALVTGGAVIGTPTGPAASGGSGK